MTVRFFFFAIPIAFALISVVLLICEIRRLKKTETCGAIQTAENVKTVGDFQCIRDGLKFP